MEGACTVITALMKRPEDYFQLSRVIGNLISVYSSKYMYFFPKCQLEIYVTLLAI